MVKSDKTSETQPLKTPNYKSINMGRIKQLMVKRASKDLVTKESDFNEDFHVNKKILGSTMPSKKVRNKIAGYIARLKRLERKAKEQELKPKKKITEEDLSYS